MQSDVLPVLNGLLLKLDRINGSRALARDVLCALSETVTAYEGDCTNKGLLKGLLSLHALLLECRPRMAHIIYDLQQLILFLGANHSAESHELSIFIEELRRQKRELARKSTEYAVELLDKQKSLLLHSFSMTVAGLLDRAAEADRRPRIFVASQEPEKTLPLIKHLDQNGFDFVVVSEYSLSHILDELDLAVFSSLTINAREHLVMAPGSAGIISQLVHEKIPVYAILTTNKFSYWEEDIESAFKELRYKEEEEISFQKTVFSHDVVDLPLFSAIITEDGIKEPGEIRSLFASKRDSFFANERELLSL